MNTTEAREIKASYEAQHGPIRIDTDIALAELRKEYTMTVKVYGRKVDASHPHSTQYKENAKALAIRLSWLEWMAARIQQGEQTELKWNE